VLVKTGYSTDKRPPGAIHAAGAPLLKPGFAFALKDFASLSGYAIDNEEIGEDRISLGELRREMRLVNGPSRLRIHLTVSQVGTMSLADLFTFFEDISQMDPEDRLVEGSTVGLSIGEESRVGAGSSSSNVANEIAFRRQNIFMTIENKAQGSLNLKPIAEELDAAIQTLPDLTPAQVEALRPNITLFSPGSMNLTPGQETTLTLNVTNPTGDPLTTTFLAPNGYIKENPPLTYNYKAGSKIGTQTLTVVVSIPSLLFDSETINFTVAEP